MANCKCNKNLIYSKSTDSLDNKLNSELWLDCQKRALYMIVAGNRWSVKTEVEINYCPMCGMKLEVM